jgi:protein-disulfide isomerase
MIGAARVSSFSGVRSSPYRLPEEPLISAVQPTARLFAVLLILLSLSSASMAQKPGAPAQKEDGITREQADQILQELREIRKLLASGAAAPRAPQTAPAAPAAQNGKINVAGLPILGRRDAPLTMIEFSDYQCPYCKAFHTGTFDELKKNWIDTGKLRFISWDLPLDFHPNAARAAQAARCAGEQNKFWEFRALLIANSDKLGPDDILGYAQEVPQLEVDKFKACVNSTQFTDAIKKSVNDANSQGVSGTPSFLIGKTQGDEVDGVILVGNKPFAEFDSKLKDQVGK